jgi:hypothetical protein
VRQSRAPGSIGVRAPVGGRGILAAREEEERREREKKGRRKRKKKKGKEKRKRKRKRRKKGRKREKKNRKKNLEKFRKLGENVREIRGRVLRDFPGFRASARFPGRR